ncbi:hypothetical protein BGX38DRAFT_1326585 [Terfezia claveryi]|nr:hypothetical protein BGX38DRAFT_1326585 [Terfezia claveryi]
MDTEGHHTTPHKWIEGFLRKHKRLEAFDKIWENIPPYLGYRQPQKRYQQITMWSGVEIRGINRVILACFVAALQQIQDVPSLSAAGQADAKIAIRCVRALTDFCLMVQYCSHTPQTIEYMNQYLQEFHQFRHIFSEFQASKADRGKAAKASKDLAEAQRAKKGADDREERQQAVHEILQQVLYRDNRSPSQAPEGCLSAVEPHRRSRANLGYHLKRLCNPHAELNLVVWSRDINLGADILEMLADNAEGGDISGGKQKRLSRPAERPTLEGKQSAEGSSGMRLSSLGSILGISGLAEWFCEYLRMNMDSSRVQGDRESIHRVRWTGKEGFRGQDKSRADWVWIWWKERALLELQMGQLDGRMVGRLEGLFSVHDETRKVHEVALVVLLRLQGPAKPSGEEGMIG